METGEAVALLNGARRARVIPPDATCWTMVASTAEDFGFLDAYAQIRLVELIEAVAVVLAGRVKVKEVLWELEKDCAF